MKLSALSKRIVIRGALVAVATIMTTSIAAARDLDYQDGEITVFVTPGEPTQLQFEGTVTGGVKKKSSALSLEHKDSDLVVFSSEALADSGESIIVRLKDGRSYPVRVKRAEDAHQRDDVVRVNDERLYAGDPTEEPAYKEKKFDYAPATQVSGLMREMVLVSEFGKKSIPGYRVSDRYKGEPVLNDGTLVATIDKIFMGPNLWGYVLDAKNLIDQSQKLNPATFRLDGTRAVSFKNWELAARPMTIEQQIAGTHDTKVYIVTRARRSN